ncbi:hypothetical protein [Streptomyces sp. G45]|uniref:hypothetical protein n=1 Tax=Streptomyces sp. G45 TaxID=3406627 RepID=UPI003C1D43E3
MGPGPGGSRTGDGESWGAMPQQGDAGAYHQGPGAGAPYAPPGGGQTSAGVPLPPEGAPHPGHAPAPQPPVAMPLPPEGTPLPPATPPGASYGGPQGAAYGGSAPLPPVTSGTPLPPAAQGGPQGQPFPSAGQPDPGYAAPAGPLGSDADATQYIPPVASGALPPEVQATDATTFLGRVPGAPGTPGAPSPAEQTAFLGRPSEETAFLGSPGDIARGGAPATPGVPDDNAPTQFIAPITDSAAPAAGHPADAPYGVRPGAPGASGDRQPPAEFDSLFRREPEPEGGASATQQMPRVQDPAPGPDIPAAPAPARQRRGRTGSRTPLLVAVGVVIAVLGVGAGALLSSGGGDADKGDDKEPLAASEPADTATKESKKPSPSADPARPQAAALDRLLGDSNDSRDTVIRAVRDVSRCDDLRQAARDLRGAARQRTGLVTRLSRLSVDKLPRHAQLTAALNRAWKASAAADNHYAAWADQVAGKKGCHKGRARPTPQQAAGNRASGEATRAKRQAAALWNEIAGKHELTKRNPTQL